MASNYHENAESIQKLLTWYCGKSAIYSHHFSIETEEPAAFYRNEIIKGCRQARLQPSGLEQYSNWAFQIGREWVDAIVFNTHRAAYQRAAWVLSSLAEVHAARGDVEKARALMNEYCKEKYNRHAAFKRAGKKSPADYFVLMRMKKRIEHRWQTRVHRTHGNRYP